MSPKDLTTLTEQLVDRDLAVLESLRIYRLATTAHLRRLHFVHGHATTRAALVATMRTLARLEGHGLVARLQRRIGGVRAGSAGIVWQLASTGDRLLRGLHGDPTRHRYHEPGVLFIAHTLVVAELAVQLRELADNGHIGLLTLGTEPTCWRSFVSPHGVREQLKPDLFTIVAHSGYEHHWFLEADLATEHTTAVIRKARIYQRYAATGAHQADHGLFPAVAWIVPTSLRRKSLQVALSAENSVSDGLFHVATIDGFAQLVAG